MWIFKQSLFFWFNVGVWGPTRTKCPGSREWSALYRLVYMHVRGWGWAGWLAVVGGVGGSVLS